MSRPASNCGCLLTRRQTKAWEGTRQPNPSSRAKDVQLLASVSDRLSQNGVKLLPAEICRLLPLCCPQRHLLYDWKGASCRRRPRLRGGSYLRPCCGRLVAALQAQTGQHAADCITTALETARNLRRALSCGPEPFEKRYVFRIPAHGRYYSADCRARGSLVARHSGFDGLIPSQSRIGKFSGGTRISMLLGAAA
jgi:hypothetical protein